MYEQIELWNEPAENLYRKYKFICEMNSHDHGFLCGMIKKVRPKKLLEIGVAEGGTTAVIMETLSMLDLNSEVWSVDLNENFYCDNTKKTGYEYINIEKQCGKKWGRAKHKFLFGQTIAGQMDEIGNGIDMVIIDTTHKMPGEVLDFLSVFPYLAADAMVVLHDVSLNYSKAVFGNEEQITTSNDSIATKVLLSSVVGDKYMVLRPGGRLPNIAAFSINENTEKYLGDLFYLLTLSWAYMPNDEILQEYRSLFERFYSEAWLECFDIALRSNIRISERKDLREKAETDDVPIIRYMFPYSRIPAGSKIALYGAGVVGKEVHFVQMQRKLYSVTAWVDKNSEACRQMGLDVKAPEELLICEFDYIVVAVESESVFC